MRNNIYEPRIAKKRTTIWNSASSKVPAKPGQNTRYHTPTPRYPIPNSDVDFDHQN
jgi:hypothetical protein